MVSELRVGVWYDHAWSVLILVLVEDGLREIYDWLGRTGELKGLNPCSCGGWSQSIKEKNGSMSCERLNPCSCGGWSQR